MSQIERVSGQRRMPLTFNQLTPLRGCVSPGKIDDGSQRLKELLGRNFFDFLEDCKRDSIALEHSHQKQRQEYKEQGKH
ncbi:hypothetical protein J6590_037058 [Homalodisca vitripennis]|nr:hypothetical protein J6590_019779 [Homalodisca vitripennis]KAG8336839.1 hypothetical protein J6590_037058 [Homalodisca vitripennis]